MCLSGFAIGCRCCVRRVCAVICALRFYCAWASSHGMWGILGSVAGLWSGFDGPSFNGPQPFAAGACVVDSLHVCLTRCTTGARVCVCARVCARKRESVCVWCVYVLLCLRQSQRAPQSGRSLQHVRLEAAPFFWRQFHTYTHHISNQHCRACCMHPCVVCVPSLI